MSDQEQKDRPEEEQPPYSKPKVHTHEPLRDLTGRGPLAQPTPQGPPGD